MSNPPSSTPIHNKNSKTLSLHTLPSFSLTNTLPFPQTYLHQSTNLNQSQSFTTIPNLSTLPHPPIHNNQTNHNNKTLTTIPQPYHSQPQIISSNYQQSQQQYSSSQQSILNIQPAIKSMKFRSKRGTRIKQLIQNKSILNYNSSSYAHYFGNTHLMDNTQSEDQDYQIDTQGIDSFDSDFGDDVRWQRKGSSSKQRGVQRQGIEYKESKELNNRQQVEIDSKNSGSSRLCSRKKRQVSVSKQCKKIQERSKRSEQRQKDSNDNNKRSIEVMTTNNKSKNNNPNNEKRRDKDMMGGNNKNNNNEQRRQEKQKMNRQEIKQQIKQKTYQIKNKKKKQKQDKNRKKIKRSKKQINKQKQQQKKKQKLLQQLSLQQQHQHQHV